MLYKEFLTVSLCLCYLIFIDFLKIFIINALFCFSGVSPAQAELSYLDKVKWLDMYGVDLHPVLVNSLIIKLTDLKDKHIIMFHSRW